MPVTVVPGSHQPKPHPAIRSAGSVDHLLELSCPESYVPDETHVVASSFGNQKTNGHALYPSTSSFVRSAIEAWGRHSHLKIRPDDVWFTILVQINFFMEKNAESLRHLFVSHEGQKYLEVWASSWDLVVDEFRVHLQKNIKASWLTDWISPGFSTSDEDDERTATVLMMGMMKTFFDYAGGETCGIPSITILGTKQDWQRLLSKIDHLEDFGVDPQNYAHRLRPILSRIVSTFDSPTTRETRNFWDQMVQAKVKHDSCCGLPPKQYIVSGWILSLFYWDSKGRASPKLSNGWKYERWGDLGSLKYDNVHYGEAALEDLPIGYAKAKFKMLSEGSEDPDNGAFNGWILAGSIGKSIVHGAPKGYREAKQQAERSWIPKESATVNEEKKSTSCFSGLFQGLNCFRIKQPIQSPRQAFRVAQPSNEGSASKKFADSVRSGKTSGSDESIDPGDGHSTIQPASGWFLFGPQKAGMCYSECEGQLYEELEGPTVDAIDSCEGTEHVKSRY